MSGLRLFNPVFSYLFRWTNVWYLMFYNRTAVMWRMFRNVGNFISNVEGLLQLCGGCSVEMPMPIIFVSRLPLP